MGWFGGTSGAKQAAEEARANWEAVKVQAMDFAKVLSTGTQGSLTGAFRQAASQVKQFVDTAAKAGDWAAITKIQEGYNAMVARMASQFAISFGGIIDALKSGLGQNSPFAEGAQNVKNITEAMKGFVQDTQVAFGGEGSADNLFDKNGSVNFRNTGTEASNNVSKALSAAQSYLVSLLGQAPVLSEVASAIAHLNGTAGQLQQALVDLGMTSEEAAQAISNGVNTSMAALADTFVNGFQREINSALGQDYLNSAADLIAKRATALSDAALLGTGTDLIDRWFTVSAQKLVDGAELVGTGFQDLLAAFPDLQGSVHEFVAEVVQGADAQIKAAQEAAQLVEQAWGRVASYQDRIFAAGNDNSSLEGALAAFDRKANQERLDEMKAGNQAIDVLEQALAAERLNIIQDFADAQKKVMEEARDYVLKIGQSIRDYLNGLKTGDKSILSPQDRLRAAQSQFNEQLALAQGGDRNAIDSLTKYSDVLLEQAKAFYASSSGYVNIFNSVTSALNSFAARIESGAISTFAQGGLIPGYANGGMVGNGIFNVDSVLARYAGGGSIGLAGGEGILTANATRSVGGASAVDFINRNHRFPPSGNDNSAVVAELKAMRAELAALRSTTANGAVHVGDRVDAAAGVQKRSADETRQASNRPAAYGTRKVA